MLSSQDGLQEWARLASSSAVWQHLDLRNTVHPEQALTDLARVPGSLLALVQQVSLQFATAVQDRHLQHLHTLQLRQLSLDACHRCAGEALCLAPAAAWCRSVLA